MFVEGGTKTSPVASADAKRRELQTAPTDWIEREIGELAAHIAAATCRWLELVAEFDRRSAHEAWGFHSCGGWLAWRCSIDPRSAREHMRVARALEELPLVRERFSYGELSYSKVRAITRVATPEIEVELVEMARFATAAQLERLVRGYRRAVSLESAEAAHRDRFLSCEWDEDGSLCIRGRLAPEDGVLFLKALDAGREAIRDRDEGQCRFPGCENRRWIDAHHIVHWARGGETELENLMLLCGHHHRLVHEGGFGVGVQADGSMSFRRPDGKAVPSLPPPSRGSCKKLRASNREAGRKITSMASMPLGRGEPFDRELAVAGLLARGPT